MPANRAVPASLPCPTVFCSRVAFAQASPDYSRIVNTRHFGRLKELLDTAGGEIVVGGQTDRDTKYIAPTIIRNVSPDAKVMQVRRCHVPWQWICGVRRLWCSV